VDGVRLQEAPSESRSASVSGLPALRVDGQQLRALRAWAGEFDLIDPRRYRAVDFVGWIEVNLTADADLRRRRSGR
jgi:hypothetical protein